MTNLIEYNAYRIFGLDTNSNQKNILKRYKELINRLKINDSPIYGSDFQLPPSFRDENSVNDALKRLQNPKNNLKEYFFWFSISDFIDEKAFNYLQKNDVSKAIKTWKDASKKTNFSFYNQ